MMSDFLQLLAIIVPVCTIVVSTLIQNVKLREIHILVNSQLQTALTHIDVLKDRIAALEAVIEANRKL